MKILFLEIDTESMWALASVGPSFIASYIRERGHEAALLRVKPEQEMMDVISGIEKESPHVLGFSITARQWPRALHVARAIRTRLDIPIIAGGLQPTFAASTILETGLFDAVCIGEGEEAVYDILAHLEEGKAILDASIPNIQIKGDKPPPIRRPVAVDVMPFMARDLLDETKGIIHVSTTRGCPFPCTFCTGGVIVNLYGDRKYIRRRSVENVLNELRYIRNNAPIHYVIFLDDTFTLDKEWVKEFCRLYGQDSGTGFSINARADTVTPDMINILAQAGCKHIIYGVESGSRRIREILKRPVDDRPFIDAFRWTKEAGIMVTANYMIGIPGETPDDIQKTISLHERLAPDDFGYSVFYPYPGTPLFDLCRKKGYLPENYLDLTADNRRSILTLPGLTKEEISDYYNVFTTLREKNYLQRYGGAFSEAQKAQAVRNLQSGADHHCS